MSLARCKNIVMNFKHGSEVKSNVIFRAPFSLLLNYWITWNCLFEMRALISTRLALRLRSQIILIYLNFGSLKSEWWAVVFWLIQSTLWFAFMTYFVCSWIWSPMYYRKKVWWNRFNWKCEKRNEKRHTFAHKILFPNKIILSKPSCRLKLMHFKH